MKLTKQQNNVMEAIKFYINLQWKNYSNYNYKPTFNEIFGVLIADNKINDTKAGKNGLLRVINNLEKKGLIKKIESNYDLYAIEIIDNEESETTTTVETVKKDTIILSGRNIKEIRQQLHKLENKGIYFGVPKWKKNIKGWLVYAYNCNNQWMDKKEYNDIIIDSFIEIGNILTSGEIRSIISKYNSTFINVELTNKGYLLTIKVHGSNKEFIYFIDKMYKKITKKPNNLETINIYSTTNSNNYPILYHDLYNVL